MGQGPFPTESVVGPMIALTNEHAGSDGDIFSHSFKLMGLGKLIGQYDANKAQISGKVPLTQGSASTSNSALRTSQYKIIYLKDITRYIYIYIFQRI